MSLEGPRFRDETEEVGERLGDLAEDETLLEDEDKAPIDLEDMNADAASEAADDLEQLANEYLNQPSSELRTQIRKRYQEAVDQFGEFTMHQALQESESEQEMSEAARTIWDIVG